MKDTKLNRIAGALKAKGPQSPGSSLTKTARNYAARVAELEGFEVTFPDASSRYHWVDKSFFIERDGVRSRVYTEEIYGDLSWKSNQGEVAVVVQAGARDSRLKLKVEKDGVQFNRPLFAKRLAEALVKAEYEAEVAKERKARLEAEAAFRNEQKDLINRIRRLDGFPLVKLDGEKRKIRAIIEATPEVWEKVLEVVLNEKKGAK